jgi:predicted transcriptional regulator of viral defense system
LILSSYQTIGISPGNAGIGQKIIDELQKTKTASYVVLDTELPKTGRRSSRWSVQQNLETETIKSAIYT